MAQIVRRVSSTGEISFRARVRLKGSQEQSATFERRTDARRWIQQTETAIREGRFFPSRDVATRTVAQLCQRYIELEAPKFVKTKVRETRVLHLTRWSEWLGDLPLSRLTAAVLSERRDRLRQRVSAATVNRYLASLSHALSLAAGEWGWLHTSPMRGVRRLTEPKRRLLVAGESRDPYLDADERMRLLAAIRETEDDRLYDLAVTALTTGARESELLGLRWADTDLDRGRLTFRDTKNGTHRTVAVAGPALDLLRRRSRVRRIGSSLVFADRFGQGRFPRRSWERARSAAGFAGLRFHDLRHIAASEMVMSGASLAEVAEVLGHKTLAMVQRYAHLAEGHTAAVVVRTVARMFGSGSGGSIEALG